MKYSEALRKGSTLFTPATSGNWFDSTSTACATAAIGYVLGGMKKADIKPWAGKPDCDDKRFEKAVSPMQDIEIKKLPCTWAEFKKMYKAFYVKAGFPVPTISKDMIHLGTVVTTLNDYGWKWTRIIKWLESEGQ